MKKINALLVKGRKILSESQDAIKSRKIYMEILDLYNSLPPKDQKELLNKIVLFYEDLNELLKFQKANMYLLQLKMALKTNQKKQVAQFYSVISKLYGEMHPKYRNEIYNQFLEMELEMSTFNPEGGNQDD